jgi:hypothetical protein
VFDSAVYYQQVSEAKKVAEKRIKEELNQA